MNFREMIEKATEKKGTTRELAKCLEVAEQTVSNAKGGVRGLPDIACVKLAQILEIEFGKVIAARNEWTAKTDKEREFWHPLANAAGIASICVAIATTYLAPSPANAATGQISGSRPLCIMSNMRRRFMTLAWAIRSIVSGNWLAAFDNYYFADHTTPA